MELTENENINKLMVELWYIFIPASILAIVLLVILVRRQRQQIAPLRANPVIPNTHLVFPRALPIALPPEPIIIHNIADRPDIDALPRYVEEQCIICLETPPNILLVPCMHQCLCLDDLSIYYENTCPVCRKNITDYVLMSAEAWQALLAEEPHLREVEVV